MNTAIKYDDRVFYAEDSENLEDILSAMRKRWETIFTPGHGIAEIARELRNVALMAWLPAKNNIPVSGDTIESFRAIFMFVKHSVLANSNRADISPRERASLEKSNLRLAKAIAILDIANDPGIASLFPFSEN